MVQMCMTDLESTMKKGKNLFGILVTLCMVGGLLLPGCVPKSMDDEILNNMKISMDQEILGARDFGYGQVSVNETGIFYFDAGVMSYYDYEMDEKYVLCSTPQCRHNSSECNAYMGDEEVYGGYAMYDGYVYVLYRSSESEYLELARMDTAGQNKEISAGTSGKVLKNMVIKDACGAVNPPLIGQNIHGKQGILGAGRPHLAARAVLFLGTQF